MDKLLAFRKCINNYVLEKGKILTKISQLLKILQNQIEHFNYVKSTKPSQDFMTQFENVQTIVLEKINKRIEKEMKVFIELRSQYVILFNELKVSVENFVKELKTEANSLKTEANSLKTEANSLKNCDQISSDRISTIEPDKKHPNKSKGKSKIKSNTSVQEKANNDLVVSMTPDGICVVREILREIILLENMNVIKLIQSNNYEMVKVFSLDDFHKTEGKFKSVELLLKCFCESSLNRNCVPG